ncbi:MAG TPA: ABC transporter permease subunit [Acidimicrobiales bacterium]|nr:ABC transporter permease subunit [Acidimicrobiales bacterium]
MTTLTTVPVRPEEDATLRPVPWRQMAWITWRQHRLALTGVVTLLGALALYLWRAGLQLHHGYGAATACRPASSIACVNAISDFMSIYDHTTTIIPALLQAVPALIGAFVGAPVLARELETGTFRYAWTQGFGRWRWTLAKLIPLAVVVAAAAGVFSLLFSWYYQPFIADGQSNRLGAIVFDLRGIAFASWTLAAFSIGAVAGIFVRRVVPAILASLAAYTGLAVVVGVFLREHYLTALVTSRPNVPASALITGNWGTKDGTVAFVGRPPIDLLQQFCPPSAVGPGKPSLGSFAQCFSQHGYTLWTSYQPASRFWPFQWIEGGWLLALSALLIAATVWMVRGRAT